MKKNQESNISEMQMLIARVLRIGVFTAAAIAAIGGIIYLVQHGGEPMKDYTSFSYDALPDGYEQYTTLHGILGGLSSMSAISWIQLGVIVLFLTPIMRVALSFVDFLKQHDWLYATITAIVLAVILFNSISPLL